MYDPLVTRSTLQGCKPGGYPSAAHRPAIANLARVGNACWCHILWGEIPSSKFGLQRALPTRPGRLPDDPNTPPCSQGTYAYSYA